MGVASDGIRQGRIEAIVLLASAAAIFATPALVVGCAEQVDPTVPEVGESAAQPQALPYESRDSLPEGFPIEIPVMDGEIVQAGREEEDRGYWFYAMRTPHDDEAVADWYAQAFTSRSWLVTETADDGDILLLLTKGTGAWTTARIRSTDEGTRIECWTGIGTPVPPDALSPVGQEV